MRVPQLWGLRTSSVTAFLFAVASTLGGQSLPTPHQLAARHDSLMGGRQALEAHKSVHVTGTFAIPAMGMDAPMEILKVKPNKLFTRTALGPAGEVLSGYDGKNAWAVQPGQAPMLLTGAQAEQLTEQADFYGSLPDYGKYAKVETLDESDFEGKRSYRVQLTRANGDVIHEYYEVATGLRIGGASSVETPQGKVDVKSIVSEYKEFGGVRFATKVITRNPQFEIILTITSVVFDTLDESAVAPPDAVKTLIKP